MFIEVILADTHDRILLNFNQVIKIERKGRTCIITDIHNNKIQVIYDEKLDINITWLLHMHD